MEDHEKYMQIALQFAEKSLKRGEFPVGCVMVRDGEVISTAGRIHTDGNVTEMDHTEIIALRSLLENGQDIQSKDLSDVTVYSTMEPCLMCFSTLILNGVRTIVYGYEDVMGGGTNLPLDKLNPLYNSMEIEIVSGVCRQQSLALFQQFFQRPDNHYWKGSLLARYTLEQEVKYDI